MPLRHVLRHTAFTPLSLTFHPVAVLGMVSRESRNWPREQPQDHVKAGRRRKDRSRARGGTVGLLSGVGHTPWTSGEAARHGTCLQETSCLPEEVS